jgi:hypothetical protein
MASRSIKLEINIQSNGLLFRKKLPKAQEVHGVDAEIS